MAINVVDVINVVNVINVANVANMVNVAGWCRKSSVLKNKGGEARSIIEKLSCLIIPGFRK